MTICNNVQVNDSPVHRRVRMNPCRCITLTRAYRTYGVRDDEGSLSCVRVWKYLD
jgi:hypothetical protein